MFVSSHDAADDEELHRYEPTEAPWEDEESPKVPQSAVEGARQVADGESVSLEQLLADAESATRDE